MPDPRAALLTPAEVAERLKVSLKTVRRLLASGALTASRVGRQWRISELDLKRFLAQSVNGDLTTNDQ